MGVFSKLKTCVVVGTLAVYCSSSRATAQEAQQGVALNLEALGLGGALGGIDGGEGGLNLNEVANQIQSLGGVSQLVQRLQETNPAAFTQLVEQFGVANLIGDDGVLNEEALSEHLERFNLADLVENTGSIGEIAERIEERLSDAPVIGEYVENLEGVNMENINPAKLVERVQDAAPAPQEVADRVGQVTSGIAEQAQELLELGSGLVENAHDLLPSGIASDLVSLPDGSLVEQAQNLLPVEELVNQAQDVLSIPEGVSEQAQQLGEQLRESLTDGERAAAAVLESSEEAVSGVVGGALSSVREQIDAVADQFAGEGSEEEGSEEEGSEEEEEYTNDQEPSTVKFVEQLLGREEGESLVDVAGDLLSNRGGAGGVMEGLVERAQEVVASGEETAASVAVPAKEMLAGVLQTDGPLPGAGAGGLAESVAQQAEELRERASQFNPLTNGLPTISGEGGVAQQLAEQAHELVDRANPEGGLSTVNELRERLAEQVQEVGGGYNLVDRTQEWLSSQDDGAAGLVQDVVRNYVPQAAKVDEAVREQIDFTRVQELVERAREGDIMRQVLAEVMNGGENFEGMSAFLEQLNAADRTSILRSVAEQLSLPAVPSSLSEAIEMAQQLSSDEKDALLDRLPETTSLLRQVAAPVLGGGGNLRGSDDRRGSTGEASPAQVSDILRSLISEFTR